MGWKSVTKDAKKGHRPKLEDWSRDRFHERFPEYSKSIQNQGNMGYQHFTCKGEDFEPYTHTIPKRLDARDTSPQDFRERYEAHGIPCVITSVPQGFDVIHDSTSDHHFQGEEKKSEHHHNDENNLKTIPKPWRALDRWTLEALNQDTKLRERRFKCGERDSGSSIRIRLKHFLRYLHNNIDDSPLYIFDSSFDDDSVAKSLLSDYRVPVFFDEDLFKLVSESRRPPYRWFLIGPERSGTCVHIDPLATSAWNTLIVGKKRWVLFPPNVPKSVVKGNDLIKKGEDDEAVHYFTTILPRIKQAAIESRGEGKYQDFECYEFTQYEGETVYIPNGWWHAVLNLTHTVGVTQNFCSSQNFDQVWKKTRTGRKKMAYKWLLQLDKFYPHLAKRAREMNSRDNFVMKYDPQEVARREREEDERKKQKRKL